VKKVLVAMSGGVDSSVVAALLKEQGYDVIGITMQVWDYTESCDITPGQGTCCSSVDVQDARSVADKLEIPFYVLNCENKFQAYVIDPFIHEYLEGRTPNPCVNCNTFLKFDHLFVKMKELGCDYLATGHYVKRIVEDKTGAHILLKGKDPLKDQSYFLFTLKKELLNHLLFPIGDMEKEEVRKHAERFELANARKKDSQEICFVSKLGYAKFIESRVSPDLLSSGEIIQLPEGRVIGTHQGIHHFTIGQRRGLGFDHHEPLFVVRIDAKSSKVFVGPERMLYHSEMVVRQINWMSDLKANQACTVKIRHRHQGAKAEILKNDNGTITVKFNEPQRAVTPGQAAVFYHEEKVLGGGWITSMI
jgi:tRNA-specific 2-thiouridylase